MRGEKERSASGTKIGVARVQIHRRLLGTDEPLPVIVEHADRPQPVNLRHVDRLLPPKGIYFSVKAFLIFAVPASTVSALHAILSKGLGPVAIMTPLLFICLGVLGPSFGLNLQNGSFEVHGPGGGEHVFLSSPKRVTINSVMYTRNKRYAVWDKRGITVRDAKFVASTHLEEVPTNPRFFSADEIKQNFNDATTGKAKAKASALSGSAILGNRVYFLVRWTLTSGATWFEALVEVDLATKHPVPKVVERQVGLSFADAPADDRLIVLGDRLGVLSQTGHNWGLSLFKPSSQSASFVPLGKDMVGYKVLGGTTIAFAEATEAGTKRIGSVDLRTRLRRDWLESRDFDHLVNGPGPMVAFMAGGKLRTLGSGAELDLPADAGVWRSRFGVIVGVPASNPKRATLYDPASWQALARWPTRPTAKHRPPLRSAAS